LSRIVSLLAALAVATPLLAGCATISPFSALGARECMARVMYFESIRSSAEGMLAVGTVVMNRLADPRYPKSVCGVVGQPNQFAPGVLWKPMKEGKSLNLARSVADRVLRGERHPGLRTNVKFFHTAGLTFPYRNMRYVLEAGGNIFYYKQ
jgi:spore germination cell wall hydrolase CwlJ-like protein